MFTKLLKKISDFYCNYCIIFNIQIEKWQIAILFREEKSISKMIACKFSFKSICLWPSYCCLLESLILYFCSCFCECRQCLSNWEVQTWQMAPCHNHWDSAVLLKLVSLRFMHSTLRYSPKRKGHPKAFLPLILKLLRCFYNHVVKFAKRRIFYEKCHEKSDFKSNAW